MMKALTLLVLGLDLFFHTWLRVGVNGWVMISPSHGGLLKRSCHSFGSHFSRILASSRDDEEDAGGAAAGDGSDLAAEFFKLAQQKGIALDASDLLDDDEDDLDNEESTIPPGAVNDFLEYETVNVGENIAANVSLTNDQLYSEVKERVLDTAGGFVEYVKALKDDDETDDDDEDDESEEDGDVDNKESSTQKIYKPPETVPNSELTAGEVVLQVLESLRNNNVPTRNRGVEILFGFSSPTSQVQTQVGLTPDEYADYLEETEYKVLLDPDYDQVSIEKADYSVNGKKAFFTARLAGLANDPVNVNFILSSCSIQADDEKAWLVDSILIRPESMRRRRRR